MSAQNPSQFVDPSRFGSDKDGHVLDLTQKHNALSLDVDGISGNTVEEKKEFHGLMGLVRRIFHFYHGKSFLILILIATIHFGLSTLKQLGLSPEQASRLVEAVVKIVEKLAGAV